MASGKTLGAFGLTEPNAGSDAGGTQTKAVLDGDEYVISGEKCWITNAEYANTIIVTAVNGVEENGRKRISAFIVPTTSEGLTISSPYDKMGVRASNTCEIVLDGVRVPKENILGDVNKGFKQFLYTLDGGRISIAKHWQLVLRNQPLNVHCNMRKNVNNLESQSLISKRFNLN